MNSHKRQSSTGSFNMDYNHFQTSFSSLENFMILTKLMQDEIMVPCKLKDKIFDKDKLSAASTSSLTSLSSAASAANGSEEKSSEDVLDHYRFLLLIRNQFMQTNPFRNQEEEEALKDSNFKTIFENLKHHYSELMSTLDSLSNEAKAITDIYKENV